MANTKPGNQETDCQLCSKSNPKLREAVENISTKLTDERSMLLKNGDGNTLVLQNILPNDAKSIKVTIKQRFKDACTECEKSKVQLEEFELERSFFERILNTFLTTLDSAVESMGPVNIKLPDVPKLANENRWQQIIKDRKSIGDKIEEITDRLNVHWRIFASVIKNIKKQNDDFERKVKDTEKVLMAQKEENANLIGTLSASKTELVQLRNQLEKNLQREKEYKKRLKEEEMKTKAAEEAKTEFFKRLRNERGVKLNLNNPAIADLSDPNRATKLAEMYIEIYDNEWTDAIEELEKYGYTEEISIRLLLDIVKRADQFCKKKAEDQIQDIENGFFMSNTDEDKMRKMILSMLKHQRKLTAEKSAERIYKEFSTRHYQTYRISAEYVKKIVKLCWLMAVQDPPICLGNEANAYDRLDTDIFKPYTQTGTMVCYTVWLPMFLHERGPLLSKGVVQPFLMRAKSAPPSKNRNDKTELKYQPVPVTRTAKYPWESSVDESHYNQPASNKNQTNDYRFARYTTQNTTEGVASVTRSPRTYFRSSLNMTYRPPKHVKGTDNVQTTGNLKTNPPGNNCRL